MPTLEELIAARAVKLDEMKALNEANPEMDDATMTDYKKAQAAFEKLTRDIDLQKTTNMLENQTDEMFFDDQSISTDAKAEVEAFLGFVRGVDVDDAKAVLKVSTDTKGGYLVPDTYANKILIALAAVSAMRKHATVIRTEGTFNMPIGGAKPVFGWIDELGTYPTTDTDFTNKIIEAWKAGGIIQISEELLADEKFGLEAHLMALIVEALDTLEGASFIDGNGVKKPLGIISTIPAGNIITASALDTIAISDVENLFLAVKAGYRSSATWIISDKFFKAIFKMKNTNGDPVWTQSLVDGEPGRLLGRPYEIDDNMGGATGEPLAIFGDLKNYTVGDRGGMVLQRLNERYAEEGMIGFKVYKRTDGKLGIDESVAVFNNA